MPSNGHTASSPHPDRLVRGAGALAITSKFPPQRCINAGKQPAFLKHIASPRLVAASRIFCAVSNKHPKSSSTMRPCVAAQH